MQKYFVALLILAQKTNTGQQGIPAARAAHSRSTMSQRESEMPLMTLTRSTDATYVNEEPVTPSQLQVVLSAPAE